MICETSIFILNFFSEKSFANQLITYHYMQRDTKKSLNFILVLVKVFTFFLIYVVY
jgi:hypothetical protein